MCQNDKACDNKDLQQNEKVAYKPAYKNNFKTDEKSNQSLPDDLAEIVIAWPKLPEHIKAAIKALTQVHGTEK